MTIKHSAPFTFFLMIPWLASACADHCLDDGSRECSIADDDEDYDRVDDGEGDSGSEAGDTGGDHGDGRGSDDEGDDGDAGDDNGGDGCHDTNMGCDPGCTLTQGYWKTHNAYANNPAMQQPWPISEDTTMCHRGWLELLHAEPMGDAWVILAHQFIAAELNIANGAATTTDVELARVGAEVVLVDCGVDADDEDEALAIAALLDAYNNGDIGPGHCS